MESAALVCSRRIRVQLILHMTRAARSELTNFDATARAALIVVLCNPGERASARRVNFSTLVCRELYYLPSVKVLPAEITFGEAATDCCLKIYASEQIWRLSRNLRRRM
jgi:hypothetical protein